MRLLTSLRERLCCLWFSTIGLNYFVGPQGQYYNYLRFLTPSFIFISGLS